MQPPQGPEKSFRMGKHDLQARPIYHHKRDSIEAHLTIVFAALTVGRWIEQATGWTIKKFGAPPAATEPSRFAPAHTPSLPQTPTDDLHDADDAWLAAAWECPAAGWASRTSSPGQVGERGPG